jgi:oleate hydratase
MTMARKPQIYLDYSVRSATMAVYHHVGVKQPISPIYHGLSDVKVAHSALRTAVT